MKKKIDEKFFFALNVFNRNLTKKKNKVVR